MICSLYLTDIRPLAAVSEQAFALLPPARQARVQRCQRESARLQSLAAGLLLRRVLSVTSDDMLSYTPHGKPYLSHGPQFNLSHSGNQVALAVMDAPVGLDLQELAEDFPSRVARRYFTADENAWAQQRPDRCFQIWTRKESVVKALGLGLGRLSASSFSVLPDKITVNDTTLYLVTQTFAPSALSIAAQVPLQTPMQPVLLSTEQLLTP